MTLKKIFQTVALFILFISAISTQAQTAKKFDVKVLYVGYNPAKEMPTSSQFRDAKSDRFEIDFKTRWVAFNTFLKRRFTKVSSIDSRAYTEAMSKDYDVTIFDQMTTPIKERVYEKDAKGQVIKYEPAQYLTPDFHSAAIFIGKVAPDLGAGTGSKFDWHCLCLNGEALNVNTSHTVFNTPIKVTPTFTKITTPQNFRQYPGGDKIPEKIPMWRVQGLDFQNSNYAIGMVSRGFGFTDSPDTEYISGGGNSKEMYAVAIGRHANFMMWGFSASPDHMTEEALDVFTNSIVYMKKFNGAQVIAKKMDDRITIRKSYLFFKNRDINKANFEKYKAQWMRYKQKDLARKKELETKKANNEPLNKFQQAFLDNFEPVPTFESWLAKKQYMGEKYFKKFGTDTNAYLTFLNNNIGYFTYIDKELVLDEDVQKLGINNNDIRLLETAISMLSKGVKQQAIAKRILQRYTEEDFSSPTAWKQWFSTNKDKLFFTESGGYKWLVDTTKN
ncbi:hypothetical protein MWU59_09255 [Flavobacteriaceae bacterium F08102]|nr:hypothetical protein [Flavobacteriaceae bacterium F08102]